MLVHFSLSRCVFSENRGESNATSALFKLVPFQIWHIFSRVVIFHHPLHVSISSYSLLLCLPARFLRVHRQQRIRWTHR